MHFSFKSSAMTVLKRHSPMTISKAARHRDAKTNGAAPRRRKARAVSGKNAKPGRRIVLPRDRNTCELEIGGRSVHLSNLQKVFWSKLGITKGDLLQYYADVADVLAPHLRDRAMVMKRYPNGAEGAYFFMKRAPVPRPDWIQTWSIDHKSGNVIDFPVIQDTAGLLWLVNLGCTDLNPWYARCDDVNRPDYLHFDLDPGEGADFKQVCHTALLVRDALEQFHLPAFAKTTGSRGIHIYVPIVRGPLQKEVWTFAKGFAKLLESKHADLVTAEYRIRNRPAGRVLIDYNQNAWGRTLASVYSVRPTPSATVSAPVDWTEIEQGIEISDFHLGNMRSRIDKVGDLWRPLLAKRGRSELRPLLAAFQVHKAERKGSLTMLELPISYAPMEAVSVDEIPKGPGWQYEPKWDGFRCLAFRDGKEVHLQSKAGQPLARYFPGNRCRPAWWSKWVTTTSMGADSDTALNYCAGGRTKLPANAPSTKSLDPAKPPSSC
jgi:bifunctional non-homologous end joining protein LigD